MKQWVQRCFLICVTAGFAAGSVLAQNLPGRPQGYVTDAAGILSADHRQSLEVLAAELEQKTSAQLAVVTVNTVRPETIEQYAVRLFQEWGIGQRGRDNGVLLLVAVQDRDVRLEVGYGLEGALTDAVSRGIIERFMIPAFQQGSYDQGVRAGAAAVASVIAREYGVTVTGQEQQVFDAVQRQEGRASGAGRVIIIIVMLVLFILNPRLFLYMMMFSALGGGRGRGGSWSGGGGGFGGGFGGFGGGFSGGGGASGRW